MILTSIKYLVGVHVGQKGFPPTVVAPLLNLLALIENELVAVGYDFSDPQIAKEEERLRQAVVRWEGSDELESFEEVAPAEFIPLPTEIIPGLNDDDDDDELAFLDDEDNER